MLYGIVACYILAFTRYCFTSRLLLLHNNIFLQTPPLLCNILHNITSYCTLPPKFEVFLRCSEVLFLFFGV